MKLNQWEVVKHTQGTIVWYTVEKVVKTWFGLCNKTIHSKDMFGDVAIFHMYISAFSAKVNEELNDLPVNKEIVK